jgi:YcxB-like protein
MLSAHYQLTQQDYLAFLRLHNRANAPRGLLFLAAGGFALLLFGWATNDLPIAATTLAIVMIAVLIIGVLVHFAWMPRHVAKTWREYSLIREPVTLTLTADGFHFVQPSAHVDVKWANVVKWDENATIFAVYATRQLAYIFPKSACEVALLNAAREGLLASGLLKKGRPRK